MDEINEPSSTEPSAPVASVAEGKPIESGTTIESTPSADTSIPSGPETSSAGEVPNVSAAGAATPSGDASALSATSADMTQQANLAVQQPAVTAPAHEAVNALDRFMERISNDFAREGKALVDAMRAEISKLVP